MKIHINSLIKTFMIVEIVLADLIFLGTVLGISSILSTFFYCTFVILLLCIVLYIRNGKLDKYYIFLAVLSIVNVMTNALLSPIANINFEYFKKVIMFLSAMTLFVLIRDIEFEELYRKYALRLGLVVSIGFTLTYFVLRNHKMYGRYLTMGFSNPNFTSFWILHGFLFSVIAFTKTSKVWQKIFLSIVVIGLLYLAKLTENRAIWLAISGFVFLLIYGYLTKQKPCNNTVLTALLLLPIVSIIIYFVLLKNQTFQSIFSFMISEGKGLDSRSTVWSFGIEKLKPNWLTGDYCGISRGTGKSQLHNTHLDVLCSYGIVPFIVFVFELRNIVTTVAKESNTVEQYVAICAFMAVILYGTFEAALFSGCEGLNYLTGALLILAKKTKQDNILKN